MPVMSRNAVATLGPLADAELFSSTLVSLRRAAQEAHSLVATAFWQGQFRESVREGQVPQTMLAHVYVSSGEGERPLKRVRKIRVVEDDDEAW
jgi:hypothetical protein